MNKTKPNSELILYQTDDGRTRIQLRSLGGGIWLTQKEIADLFGSTVANINIHTSNILKEDEYIEALLARIRDIRSSEKVFWKKVLDIYATSIDYDPKLETSQQFFATVQNKMHWAAHGHTAAEVIALRANASEPCKRMRSKKIHNRRLIWAN